jgi:calcium-dependent protein kinase
MILAGAFLCTTGGKSSLLCRQSILCDRVDLKKSYWEGISEEGKQFVAMLLEKDPAKRPTAKQALKSAWLEGHSGERSSGKQLSFNVVQRLQVMPTDRMD